MHTALEAQVRDRAMQLCASSFQDEDVFASTHFFTTLGPDSDATSPKMFGDSVVGHWSLVVRQCGRKGRHRLRPMLAACTILHHEYLRHKYINRGCGLGEVPPISARIAGVVLNSKLVACNRLRAAEP